MCGLECVCFPLGSESGEAQRGGRGKYECRQHTEKAPIPLSSTLTVGLCSSQPSTSVGLRSRPNPVLRSRGGADEETWAPTFAHSTEWWCFHLDLYHSYSCASPMNICLIHFSIFPQEGAFALVFKSIHFPGEAIATRSVKAMVSLNCNALKFPCSLLALSVFWDEPFSHNFSTICAFKDKELRFLKSCACPGTKDLTKVFMKGYFNMLGWYAYPVYIILSRLKPRPKLIIPICLSLIVNECVVGLGQFCPAVKGTF